MPESIEAKPTMISRRQKIAKRSSELSSFAIKMLTIGASVTMGGVLVSNAVNASVPSASISSMAYQEETSSFSYAFDIANPKQHTIYFTVTVDEEILLNQDCSEAKSYVGTLEDIEGSIITWEIAYQSENNQKSLQKGSISIKEAQNG